jgi:hypothetical protein
VGFHWSLVLATLRWGVICRYQAQRHLSGQLRSVELAAIGRRVCETEWDLLNLLDKAHRGDDARRGAALPGDDARRGAVRGGTGQSDPGGAGQSNPAGDDARRIAAPPGDDARRGAVRGGTGQSDPGGAGQSDPAVTDVYGRPTAAELVAAAAEFLETDVREATIGQVNFHARVAANALRIVERELLVESAGDVTDALAGLGYADETQLAAAISDGDLDHQAADVASCLRALVSHRLAVAHPGYQNE